VHEVEFFFDVADAATRARYAALAEALQGASHRLRLRPVARSVQGEAAARLAIACTADGDEPSRRTVERVWAQLDAGHPCAVDGAAVPAPGLRPFRPLADPAVQRALQAHAQAAGGLPLPRLRVDGGDIDWAAVGSAGWLTP
jgi:hypothetical protein